MSVKITKKEELIEEIKTMLPYTTITLLGPSGTGKTTILEEISQIKELNIHKTFVMRMQGLSSEDFRIPVLEGRGSNKNIKFAKIGVFQEIIDNPDKNYLVFFDRILSL